MKKSVIEGIGTLYGGTYDELRVEGIGKLKGSTQAKSVVIEGIFKGKGSITADKFTCEGIARIFKNIKAKEARVDGVLKLRRASLEADSLYCDGIIVCNKEVSADKIVIDGLCSVARMYGDDIKLYYNIDNKYKRFVSFKGKSALRLYFGREINLDYLIVDHIECTTLEAEKLHAKTVRARDVKLGKDCVVDYLECDGKLEVHPSCKIARSNKKYEIIKEDSNMADYRLVQVLDKYKQGLISADEAEQLIDTIKGYKSHNNAGYFEDNIIWPDDNKLRIVAYLGRKLLKEGEAGSDKVVVEYKGEALNIECCGNLICGDIKGNVSAGGGIQCNNIGGNASCGASITCSSIGGNASCGAGIRIAK